MKQNSIYKPVKFDFQSDRENRFSWLMGAGLIVAFAVFIFGAPGKHGEPPICPGAMGVGFFMGLASLIIFGGLRLLTNDYLLVVPGTEYVRLCTTFFFIKTTAFFCPFKEVRYVELRTETRTEKSSRYTDFSLHLVMTNSRQKSTDNISMSETSGYQFDYRVAKLRDKALQIATIIGCQIVYGDKIPPHERFQAKNLAETQEPSLEKPADVSGISVENVQSDFIDYDEGKICPACGRIIPSQNKYCNCRREF
jgi:hypothetical protein